MVDPDPAKHKMQRSGPACGRRAAVLKCFSGEVWGVLQDAIIQCLHSCHLLLCALTRSNHMLLWMKDFSPKIWMF